jgi:hypothetical protein
MPTRMNATGGVRDALGLDETYDAWLEDLEAVEPVARSAVELDLEPNSQVLRMLAVPPDAIDEVLGSAPTADGHPEIWWLLERCRSQLVRNIGAESPAAESWPVLPAHLGAMGRCFYVHVFLSALTEVRDFHRARHIPDDVSWATLADLGRHMAIDRTIHGAVCLVSQDFLLHAWRGVLYELGRLQFEQFHRASVVDRQPLFWYDEAPADLPPPGLDLGSPALDMHIPNAGPLSPEACDASLDEARSMFARAFPEVSYSIVTCTSWLLDEQLADYLPSDSNMIQFQRRFRLVPGSVDGTDEMLRLAFQRRAPVDLDSLPQRTTLERAFVTHLRRGGRWQTRTGWLAL